MSMLSQVATDSFGPHKQESLIPFIKKKEKRRLLKEAVVLGPKGRSRNGPTEGRVGMLTWFCGVVGGKNEGKCRKGGVRFGRGREGGGGVGEGGRAGVGACEEC